MSFDKWFSSVQFSSVAQSCPNSLWPHGLQHARPPYASPNPRAYSNSVHWVGDAIQPSHPLSSPSPAFNLSQDQGLFKLVISSHQVAKVLEFQLQHQSFQWTPRTPRISFRIDWLDLLAVQGTLKSLLQQLQIVGSLKWEEDKYRGPNRKPVK